MEAPLPEYTPNAAGNAANSSLALASSCLVICIHITITAGNDPNVIAPRATLQYTGVRRIEL